MLLKGLILIGAFCFGVLIKKYWTSYPHDNPVEEIVEEVIKHKTGMDIDLTPDSLEKKSKD